MNQIILRGTWTLEITKGDSCSIKQPSNICLAQAQVSCPAPGTKRGPVEAQQLSLGTQPWLFYQHSEPSTLQSHSVPRQGS